MVMSLRDGDRPSKQSPRFQGVASQSALATTCGAKANALPAPYTSGRLQSASGEELSALMPSILDKAFKGEL
jgi:hypothetical protein